MTKKELSLEEIQELIICAIRLVIIIKIVHLFGFFFGIIILYFLNQFYDYLVSKLLKIERLNYMDKFHITDDDKKRKTAVFLLKVNNFDEVKMKKLIYERLIKNIRKFRCKIVYTLFDYYWKEMNANDVYNKLINTPCIKIKEEQIYTLVKKELNSPCDQFKDVLYEFIMYKLEDGKGALIFKYDHAMTDGMGAIASLCALSDNFSAELFQGSYQPVKIPFYRYIIDVFKLVKLLYGYLGLPEKENKLIKDDIKQEETLVSFSQVYNFQDWTKINKQLNITFNEFIITTFLSALKTYFLRNNKPVPSYITTAIMIGARGVPSCVEEIKVSNLAGCSQIPLIPETDIIEKAKKVSKALKADIQNTIKPIITDFITQFFHKILPNFLFCHIVKKMTSLVDLSVANVPGPRKTLILQGMEVIDFQPMQSTGNLFANLTIYTYQNKLYINFCLDKNIPIDPDQIISLIDVSFKNINLVNRISSS
jgi:hypothetical protein